MNDGRERAATNRRREVLTGHAGTTLTDAASLAVWPTTRACDGIVRHSQSWMQKRIAENRDVDLTTMANMASWATPASRDYKDTSDPATWNCTEDRNRYDQLPRQVQLADSGPMPNGSPAATGNRGQLNPALSRWLMGYPPEWCDCAVTATQSLPRSRRDSSGRT